MTWQDFENRWPLRSSQADESAHDNGRRVDARQPLNSDLLRTLREAEIDECKLVPWGSNYTFAITFAQAGDNAPIAIYKPASGEIPLWDFESGSLYRREYASFLLSRALGWHFIPPTVVRDGPHGVGTVQLYIEPLQRAQNLFTRERYQPALKRMFVFDLLVNNADRKSSHLFVGRQDRRLWGIDHGLTFHVDAKLRTVIWNFCGESLDSNLRQSLDRLIRHQSRIGALLDPYLRDPEIDRIFLRADQLRQDEALPYLNQRRNIPYGW
jgi:uncharacterized repeat protein (TIGR03843 family)